ncbi:MAG TPA: sugar phosphate isomerase/epimerase, partial [Gemmataceae bacterium]|nr:sugar phosphate isomerase/epimerase [Gemmataceae bacterium]
MRFGYNTNGFAHHRLEDTLTILAELGYESVAITLDHYALNPYDSDLPRQLSGVRTLLRRLNLHCVIETGARFLLDPRQKHQPTLLSADKGDRHRRLDFLMRAVDIASELGTDLVSFWSGT